MITNTLVRVVPNSITKFVYNHWGIPNFIRYSTLFWDTYNFLQKSQWWDKKKLEKYQIMQLRKLLHHAYENVPYYHEIFKERHIRPEDTKHIEDLRKIPSLDKDTFKSHFSEMISKNVKTRNLPLSHTSGTTGKPLQFYQSYSENVIEWAFICHQWSRVGYRPGERRVELRGAPIDKKNPIMYRPLDGVLRLSPIVCDKNIVELYLDHMKSFGARFLHGYPSAIATFASLIRKYGLKIPFKLQAVLLASEAVYDWERELIEEVFNCRTFAHYGLAEHVVLAAECERSRFYHCVPQYGVTEVDTKTHEIIATGFLNYINPFIRYRTTDVSFSPLYLECEFCGRDYFPILETIEGRLEDFVMTPNGTMISPAVLTHPFKDLKTIKNTKLVQTALDHIVLRISLSEEVSEKSEKEVKNLCTSLKKILGPEVEIEVEIVDEIEVSSTGKFKWIKSEISE